MKNMLLAICLALTTILPCPGHAENWLDKDFAEIEAAARGTEVNFHMYGGWAHVNQWVDGYVAGELKKRYDITLRRTPMDAPVFVNKLITEKAAGRNPGSIDLLWINGENFRNAMEAGTLLGPYAERCPNFLQHVDKTWAGLDFGYPTQGYETPYGFAQFVFEYDSAATASPPETFAGLLQWAREHPGLFTYPQPPDFTGSAFIRQAFYALTGGHEQYLSGFDQALYEKNSPKLWAYLNELEPHLWLNGRNYPKDSAAMDTLFSRGEVALNMSYHPIHAQSKILEGAYPATVRTFVLEDGSIFNLHFTAIPANAPNIPGALVTANFLMSPEAQRSKYDPKNWGDFPILDLRTLTPEMRQAFGQMDLGAATLPVETLANHTVPEIPSPYLEALERDWEKFVLR